jgi:hypothetical protein
MANGTKGDLKLDSSGRGDLRKSSSFILLCCSSVEPAAIPALRLRHQVQGLRRDRPGTSRHHAVLMDCRHVSVVRRGAPLPSQRDFSGESLTKAGCQTSGVEAPDLMGEMKRATAREEQDIRKQGRFASTLIDAVRLSREPDISRPSPRLTTVITDSVGLARMILERVVR